MDNVDVTGNNVASLIIYELGTSTSAIRKFGLEVVNIEILENVLIIKKFGCNRFGIGIRND